MLHEMELLSRFRQKNYSVLRSIQNGEPIVHQIDGQFNETYYYDLPSYFDCLQERLHGAPECSQQHVYFTAIDLSYELLSAGQCMWSGEELIYDGVIPSAHDPVYSSSTSLLNPIVHPIVIEAVDMNGDLDSTMWGGGFRFVLFSETLEPLTKISGDNLQGLPNTPLPVPFVVELRDLNDGFPLREVSVTFAVTAGGGTLSVEHTKTDWNGRAESTLTLGPNFGTNTVKVSAEGLTVTFNAMAGVPVDIPDPNLRAAIEDAFDKAPGTPIAPAEMANLTRLEAEKR